MKYLITTLATLLTISNIAFASSATRINCSGTEPFWSVEVRGQKLNYADPESAKGVTLDVISSREASGAIPAGTAMVIKTKYASLALVRGSDCSDGMSEEVYSHHAVFDVGGKVLYGCCKLNYSK